MRGEWASTPKDGETDNGQHRLFFYILFFIIFVGFVFEENIKINVAYISVRRMG